MAAWMGTVIDGKYEVLKRIGTGGMSVVYLAMDKRLNKQWAVKEIRKTVNGKNDEIIVNSLLAEANLMKRLDHPALPRIVDIIDNGESIFVVMDYIGGESLDRILDEYGAQPQELVLDWAKQLCDALGYLHSQKPSIIYRDMKPANVMLKPEGNIKVIDFGIAREYKENNLADTAVMGTRGYAPPEQYGSRQTNEKSDIYALGMTMHHLLTGVDPRLPEYEYIPVRQWNPELSGGLERIIDKCTALDPEDRYQNCNELMYALEHYEEEDDDFKRKQRRKLVVFLLTSVLTVACLTVGIGGRLMSSYVNNQDYDQKISISRSTPYETRVETYLEAIDLFGSDTRAYVRLLEAYRDNLLFSDEESRQFTAKYNIYKDTFDTESEEFLELAYEAGIIYFYLYSGGDDTFRTRVLKAPPYFQTIIESGQTDFEYYDVSESYYIVGNFYEQYVDSATCAKEPTQEDYRELLESLQICIDNVEGYDYDDAAYVKLTMYKAIVDLLNSHRKGFASAGVSEDAVLNLLETVYEKSDALSVTQEKSVEVRDGILDAYEEYVSNIERAYTNTEERNGEL